MGIAYNPKIVTDGLRVYYDTKNVKCLDNKENLLVYSEDFSQTNWVKQNGFTVSANSVAAPDGTLTADTASRSATNQYLYQTFAGGSGTFTLSCWVRTASGSQNFVMQTYNGTDNGQGVVTHTATTTWQRFSTTATVTTTSSWYPCIPNNINTTFYIWGAQLEKGSTVSDYNQTVASNKTRGTSLLSLTGTESGTPTTLVSANDTIAGTVLDHNYSSAIVVSLSPNLNHEVWSMIYWVRSTGTTPGDYRSVIRLDDTNSSHNYFYNVDTRQTTNSYILGYQKDYSISSWLTYGHMSASQWDDQTWWCLGVSHNNTVFKHYTQGDLVNTQTQTRDVASYGDIDEFEINMSGSNTVYMGPVFLYDRILTDDEFKQNFNAHRERFGV